MTRPTHAHPNRRRTAAAALALALAAGTLGGGLGTAAPAAADPPPTSAGNVFHGYRLDGDDFEVIDHPDAGTVPTPALGATGTQVVGTNDRGAIVGDYDTEPPAGTAAPRPAAPPTTSEIPVVSG